MIPNIDQRALKSMMDRFGIKSTEIDATRVIIEREGSSIIIEKPSVLLIEAQGTKSFQISGEIIEKSNAKVEITDDDIRLVMEQSGINDKELAQRVLEDTNGDIAEAIIRLKNKDADGNESK